MVVYEGVITVDIDISRQLLAIGWCSTVGYLLLLLCIALLWLELRSSIREVRLDQQQLRLQCGQACSCGGLARKRSLLGEKWSESAPPYSFSKLGTWTA